MQYDGLTVRALHVLVFDARMDRGLTDERFVERLNLGGVAGLDGVGTRLDALAEDYGYDLADLAIPNAIDGKWYAGPRAAEVLELIEREGPEIRYRSPDGVMKTFPAVRSNDGILYAQGLPPEVAAEFQGGTVVLPEGQLVHHVRGGGVADGYSVPGVIPFDA